MKALSLTLNGVVQGVGFRPFIFRLASQHNWNGFIKNTPLGVTIVLDKLDIELVKDEILSNLPPLAKIDSFDVSYIELEQTLDGFNILNSDSGETLTDIPADIATCNDCLTELFDPKSDYYLYPFISCTNCGPRYASINQLPYDRGQTAFAKFHLCNRCQNAYTDPLNRRFHAQTTVCHICGPQLSQSLSEVAKAIERGMIVAVKGNSGFHLIVDAKNEAAVLRLRKRKNRINKPFALMALNTDSVEQYTEVSDYEIKQLKSSKAPIVLLKEKQTTNLPKTLNPGLNKLGFMLPSTAIYYLLFYELLGKGKTTNTDWLNKKNERLFVVTSANLSGDAVIADIDVAKEKLRSIADVIVDHNRLISMRCDDSVISCDRTDINMIRRAKGYAPEAIYLKEKMPNILALGSHLKNTLSLVNGNKVYVSQHIGDLDSHYTIEYFRETLTHIQNLYSITFDAIATELHPDFYPTEIAESLNLPIYPIQHHKAHMASVIAESKIEGPALGLILDGYGYGDDAQAWGGELFLYDSENVNFSRCGSLLPMNYFSLDKVQKEPWRMAVALSEQFKLFQLDYLDAVPRAKEFRQILKLRRLNVTTTSCGRLFDAVSSLLDVCHYNSYEAEAAMRLEALVETVKVDSALYQVNDKNQLDISELIKSVIDAKFQHSAQYASELFHGSFSYALAQWVIQNAAKYNLKQIVLNGGCFQNTVLLKQVYKQLTNNGLKVYRPKLLPFNDGGISLGQAYIAAKLHQQKLSKLKENSYVFGNSCTNYAID
ncbi:carbamoyltransferase HypF [Thiotrichales bacterium 19S3-7]|nr:carbamoyltransferase HypF [Thiotrichales bacterium 19S3-7]MCF6802065.1 carbamoyltransferase HypF [Thiotrichales bacterium 19S3-11]